MTGNSVRLVQNDRDWLVETHENGNLSDHHFSLEAEAVAWAVREATRMQGIKISRIDQRGSGVGTEI